MLDPRDFSVIETLRDGRKIEVRAQRQQDRNDLEAAILRLSDESLYRRFFIAKRRFSEQEAEHFLNIDFVNHVALVAAAQRPGDEYGARRLSRPRHSDMHVTIHEVY
jgi:hypothetical protein